MRITKLFLALALLPLCASVVYAEGQTDKAATDQKQVQSDAGKTGDVHAKADTAAEDGDEDDSAGGDEEEGGEE